jgi:uncharacterized ferritin-like protein (DUF455 family)
MELRELAEQILFATTLEQKLWCPEVIVDEHRGQPLVVPEAPGRPPELRFRAQGVGRADFPGLHQLENGRERGRLLHFLANHELLATELMALVLLRFPEAPAGFRRGVLQTLKDEQIHTRLYLERMRECGIEFGELPVNGYFWRCLSTMESPIDYVAGLSLTFEQANLDFCQYFSQAFEQVGDEATAKLLTRIYGDEIGHVAYGLKWFRRWKDPRQTDWQAFSSQLKFPLSPQRAKGPRLNLEGRRAAGLDAEFIAELNVYSQSKGRTPGVFISNPLAEGYIAYGKTFTPRKPQALLAADLANLPQFFCRQDDIVLVSKRPSVQFLSTLKQVGFPLPEFIELRKHSVAPPDSLRNRKISRLRPWAWSPDSLELLEPLFANLTGTGVMPDQCFNANIARLYSKSWSAEFLQKFLSNWAAQPWLCARDEIGATVDTADAALEAIAAIRRRGHHRVVAKQAHGLAGQNAIRLWEPGVLDAQRHWIERAVADGRSLVVEPWLEREVDFSVQLEMNRGSLSVCGYTGLISDAKGQYQGNWTSADFAQRIPAKVTELFRFQPDFSRQLRRLYEELRVALETALNLAGYAGPIGIDSFVYHSATAGFRIKPIVEINPRYTMGRLIVELMRRACPGSCGLLRLVNRRTAQAAGFAGLVEYAEALKRSSPVYLEGRPAPKIRHGAICLNEPATASVCLVVFEVARTLDTGGLPTTLLQNAATL